MGNGYGRNLKYFKTYAKNVRLLKQAV